MSQCLVGFMPNAPDAHPLAALLRRGYGHCWMARQIDETLYLWLEWTPTRLMHGLLMVDVVHRTVGQAYEVLALPWPGPCGLAPAAARRTPKPVMSCVTVIADALGLPVRPWTTPWRLACALRARGAQAITGRPDEDPR